MMSKAVTIRRWWTRCALAAAVLLAPGAAAAATYSYVQWTAADVAGGTASGVIALPDDSTVTVTFTAKTMSSQPGSLYGAQINGQGTNYWMPSGPYISANVENAPPDADLLQLAGGQDETYTVTLSEPIKDPIMAILSLGQNSLPITYNFDAPFTIVSQGTGYFGGSTSSLVQLDDNVLQGSEGHGTIQFLGTFSTLSWTVPDPEVWHGFTFGIRTTARLEPPDGGVGGSGGGLGTGGFGSGGVNGSGGTGGVFGTGGFFGSGGANGSGGVNGSGGTGGVIAATGGQGGSAAGAGGLGGGGNGGGGAAGGRGGFGGSRATGGAGGTATGGIGGTRASGGGGGSAATGGNGGSVIAGSGGASGTAGQGGRGGIPGEPSVAGLAGGRFGSISSGPGGTTQANANGGAGATGSGAGGQGASGGTAGPGGPSMVSGGGCSCGVGDGAALDLAGLTLIAGALSLARRRRRSL